MFLEEIKSIQKEVLISLEKEWEIPINYQFIEIIQNKLINIISYVSNGTYGLTHYKFKKGFLFIRSDNYWLDEKKLKQLGFKKYKTKNNEDGWIKKII